MQKRVELVKHVAGTTWAPLALAAKRTEADVIPQLDATLLMALAASGGRIAAAGSLADWRTILVEEVSAYLPGAECNVYLSADWPPVRQTTPEPPVVVPLAVDEQVHGRLVAHLPAASGRAGAGALLGVLARFAA